jgi:hypothetical protein
MSASALPKGSDWIYRRGKEEDEWRVEGTYVRSIGSLGQMRINTQPSPICLCKPPKNIFRSFINIGSTSVFGEVMDKRDFG